MQLAKNELHFFAKFFVKLFAAILRIQERPQLSGCILGDAWVCRVFHAFPSLPSGRLLSPPSPRPASHMQGSRPGFAPGLPCCPEEAVGQTPPQGMWESGAVHRLIGTWDVAAPALFRFCLPTLSSEKPWVQDSKERTAFLPKSTLAFLYLSPAASGKCPAGLLYSVLARHHSYRLPRLRTFLQTPCFDFTHIKSVDAKSPQKDAQQQRSHPLLPAYAWNNAWVYRLNL